jgi:hypothetical protein
MNMGDAMMNRPIVARWKTVLRQRRRNSTGKQRGNKRETFQDVHDHPPKRRTRSLTRSFRTPMRRPVYDDLACSDFMPRVPRCRPLYSTS